MFHFLTWIWLIRRARRWLVRFTVWSSESHRIQLTTIVELPVASICTLYIKSTVGYCMNLWEDRACLRRRKNLVQNIYLCWLLLFSRLKNNRTQQFMSYVYVCANVINFVHCCYESWVSLHWICHGRRYIMLAVLFTDVPQPFHIYFSHPHDALIEPSDSDIVRSKGV